MFNFLQEGQGMITMWQEKHGNEHSVTAQQGTPSLQTL